VDPNQLTLQHARELDTRDPLAAFRSRFFFPEECPLYLDGNSLGRVPFITTARMRTVVVEQWGADLIRSWNKNWWDAPVRVGEKIARLVGAAPGQVVVSDSTSVDLFKLAAAALLLRPGRTKIVTDTLNFPSDVYVLQGLAGLLSPGAAKNGRNEARYEIVLVDSQDGGISPDLAALEAAIDEDTALVTLSHAAFKSGYLYDMAHINDMAHARGALTLWDLSHSVGVVSIELDASRADFAIGCTYKYLNGGPGSPAFLYVNRSHQSQAVSPIWGWFGQNEPFAFGLEYVPAPGVTRFLAGSPPVLSMLALEASLEPLLEAGVEAVRRKSILLTDYAVWLSEGLLAPHGFSLGSPTDPARRGSHISLRHREGYRINRALIEEMCLIPDFREPDNIRLGFAPLYTSFEDVWTGIERIRLVMEEKRHLKYSPEREKVT
jgi:kynureninase